MYDAMKAEPRYLVDYKTFTSSVDAIYSTAESLNATHANDVFLASLDEFRNSLMKRKEARALVKQYQADCAAQQAAALGGAVLEPFSLFEGLSEASKTSVLEGVSRCVEALDEMEGGDNAKALLFFLGRNLSVLERVVDPRFCEDLLGIVGNAVLKAMRLSEGGVEW